ncbi:MAG: helix-turn-helix transcriptional regulator [Treponema sp.]|jgi:transcriptional regulator with XRE-family HTH domain|nr:helix-turn-helix transcriptional regulator [Treponema sp.]
MDLKHVFIRNLKKFRNQRGISQMKLAELCGTAPSYIGEIEIGRRFPSLKLIEKMGEALAVEPYLFFINEPHELYTNKNELDDTINFLARLPDTAKLAIINRISMQCIELPQA